MAREILFKNTLEVLFYLSLDLLLLILFEQRPEVYKVNFKYAENLIRPFASLVPVVFLCEILPNLGPVHLHVDKA